MVKENSKNNNAINPKQIAEVMPGIKNSIEGCCAYADPTSNMKEFIQESHANGTSVYALNYAIGYAVAGAHYGDEGKGKIVDLIIRKLKEEDYKVINIRGQGGGNAGHTVIEELTKKEYHFHYLPSGGLVSDIILLGGGMLLDPIKIHEEASVLPKEQQSKILIDGRATFCTLLERDMDGYYENWKHQKGAARVGSTGSGVGPAVSYRALCCHIQFFKAKACKNKEELKKLFMSIPDVPVYVHHDIVAKYGSMDVYIGKLFEAVQGLNVVESMPIIQKTRDEGWAVVLEVSQAFCLDNIFGNEGNFVTSTHTTIPGAIADAGMALGDISESILVCKAYATKVGGGPFTTGFTYEGYEYEDLLFHISKDVRETAFCEETLNELNVAKYIYDNNGEKGVTTGRLRDIGWYDAVAVRAAIQRNGSRILAVNCMDTLGLIPGGKAKICTAYKHKVTGETTVFWPDMQHEYEPVYETVEVGWNIKHVNRETEIPDAVWRYLAYIENYTGGHVKYIGTGGSNEDIVEVSCYGRAKIKFFKVNELCNRRNS